MSDSRHAQTTTLRDDELLIERIFEAPRDLVFRAWTSPEHVKHWWGPAGDVTLAEIEFREGGAWRICFAPSDHSEYCAGGTYQEIIEPERLVFTFTWDDYEDMQSIETVITVTFQDLGGATRMSFHQTPFESVEERDGHTVGWSQCLDRLEEYVGSLAN